MMHQAHTEAVLTLEEIAVAFLLICGLSLLIYSVGRLLAPKSIQSENGQSTYACGEKASFPESRINVSLYKYLIYFLVLDSSVLLMAFASLALRMTNALLLIFYVAIVLVSVLLLLGGDE